mgnify:CR=1 FL=1
MTVIACIQMASGPNVRANLLEAERLIEQAVHREAKLVILPENFALMGLSELDKVAACETDGSGPMQTFLSTQAARHGIWIVGGAGRREFPALLALEGAAAVPAAIALWRKEAEIRLQGMADRWKEIRRAYRSRLKTARREWCEALRLMRIAGLNARAAITKGLPL